MGPLAGVRIVEMSNIGPAPFCAMLLADLGAEVISVQRLAAGDLGFAIDPRFDLLNRSKRAVGVDLKAPEGVALVRDLVARADLLIEGFRPGVMERLGLGPEVCSQINPKLVYGRLTGWGQTGPMARMAGHDINYISMTGALAAIGPKDGAPAIPLNLVGDFAGGSLYLAMGLLAALTEARASGTGQVVDAAMVDGVASLMAMHMGYRQADFWSLERGTNAVDGGAPWYAAYETKDGKWMAVGAVEKRFYAEFIARLGLGAADLPGQNDRARWDDLRASIAARFMERTRDEWVAVFDGSDACVTPVLDMDEARDHPAAVARETYLTMDGVVEPAPAPRFSRTPGRIQGPPPDPQVTTAPALADWGIDADRIAGLRTAGIIAGAG
ncbi:CoA transferase [Paracoccus sp. YIM 132242]|uniref:CoA transferase n=1 Tax=Paracoccus lichenicola TaxID=2665644 RepID=A0A6L6HTV2_9RHOB|nr:CaiB/BaiF CoA-transferase family protein [Paracoccus lichenicola]MTE01643.1 CoA transferase [Paracoccus lichenicola]